MVRRVLLNNTGLSYSPAGIDVTTATVAQMLLDTSTQRYMGVFLPGTILFNSFAIIVSYTDANGENQVYHYALAFGRTFASIPIVKAATQNSFQTGSPATPMFNVYQVSGQTGLTWTTAVDHVDFYFQQHSSNNVYPKPPSAVAYVVAWQH